MQALRPKLWAPLVLVLGGVGAFAATRGAPVEAADHNDPPNRVHSTGAGQPRAATDDGASDIADVFVWNRDNGGTQMTVFAMSFDGPNAHGALSAVPCDPDVLYQIHVAAAGGICTGHAIDPNDGTSYTCSGATAGNCGTYTPTGGSALPCPPAFDDMHTINVRFAPNGAATTATCVIEAEFAAGDGGTPILPASIVGNVETNITSGSATLYAGLRDDAFFFDLAGFQATLAAADGHAHFTGGDSFAGLNTPVIVLEVPTSAVTQTSHALPPGSTAIRVWGSTSRFHPHT